MIFSIAAVAFVVFIAVYIFLAAAVLHHLYHYAMPGWTAVRFVVPVFFLLSSIFFAFAAYFFFTAPWGQFEASTNYESIANLLINEFDYS